MELDQGAYWKITPVPNSEISENSGTSENSREKNSPSYWLSLYFIPKFLEMQGNYVVAGNEKEKPV
jgi:hypothetical protein